ncbi:MAG: hypothetical protein KC619_22800, partial [Myxococcales bacterium]|nr:hypothetical protein [Myxococcales bacterium]
DADADADAFPPDDAAPSTTPSAPRASWSEAPETEEPVSDEPPRDGADARRERPDYSGRGDPPRDPADDVLWIPRILFSPLYVISEYLLRQPIGAIVTEIERSHLFDTFFDFFTWGDDRQAGLVPTVLYDFGFLPSVGLYLWWNDLGTHGHDLRVVGGFWGDDWLHAKILDRIRFDDQNELSFWVEALRRPDYIWHGGGWDAERNERARFERSNVGGGVQFQNRGFWRNSGFRYFAMVDYNDFDNSDYDEDHDHQRPLEQAVAFGWFDTLPDGYTNGYFAFRQRLEATLDSREERPAPGHGVRAQAWLEHGLDMQRADDSHWLRYGGQVAGFLDLGEQRVVQVLGYVDVVDSIGATDQIPFTELVWLSRQPLTMGGFQPGTLVGRSATVLTVEYHWPIWVWVEGSLHYSVGNAFGPQLGDFDVERLRQSFGIGFRTIGDRDNSALIMLAFGTEPFVRGADVTSVRFLIGSQSGF